MTQLRSLSLSATGFLAALVVAGGGGAATLSAELALGGLRASEKVLVDDGSCPAAQIREVAGGGDISMSTGERMPGSPRTRRCIARP